MKLPFESKERELLVKREAVGQFGQDANNRSTEELMDYGVINLDKPKGPTSHQVADYVQKILHIKKSGHSGSLDPGVTGVLPVALGRATRVVQALLKAGKEYVCVMHLHEEVPEEKLREVISSKFIGKIEQLPPIKSAVKRALREREIYYIEIIEIDGKDVLFRTGVEAGTYIRKLCHDIGKELGIGAHMAELRRTKAGCFSETEDLVTMQDLTDAFHYYKEGDDKLIRHCIKPIEYAVRHLSKVYVLDNAIASLTHGVDLKLPGISKIETGIEKDEMVAVMTLKEELVGIGTSRMPSEQMLNEQKGLGVEMHKVFMKI